MPLEAPFQRDPAVSILFNPVTSGPRDEVVPFQITPHPSGILPGVDAQKLNQWNDVLGAEAFMEAQDS